MPGLNFLPTANPSPQDQQSANALTPGQSAISTISLNLPTILGARPLTNSNLLGGGMTGASHSGVDPNQIVLQALMHSAMSTPGSAVGSSDDELRRRLASMFGAPSTSGQTPTVTTGGGPAPMPITTPAPSPPAPIFTPGQNATVYNSPMNLNPVTNFSTNQALRPK